MKFYHVTNKGKGRNVKSHWLIANDKDDAKRIQFRIFKNYLMKVKLDYYHLKL